MKPRHGLCVCIFVEGNCYACKIENSDRYHLIEIPTHTKRRRMVMGICLNPGADMFQMALSSEIYVDKSELIAYTNSVFGTENRYLCVSRPRRFGKSMAANMLFAYY